VHQDVNFLHVYGVRFCGCMSSRFTRLQSVHCTWQEKPYVRFSCNTGGAMGMNMVTKGAHNVIEFLTYDFPYMDVIGISGDAILRLKNSRFIGLITSSRTTCCSELDRGTWQISSLKGSNQRRDRERELTRGTRSTSSSYTICDMMLNMLKNLTVYAVAGSLGRFKAHASNIVFDVFIAIFQDPAQNMESSQCITMMENH
ncbi:hypothetical protein IGI04_011142, partial [Brassica rapa subsp. trilocularis]